MEIKGSKSDLEAVLSEDFFERCEACENLLQANGIELKITDVNQVFRHITVEIETGNEGSARQHYRDAQAALISFIKGYGQKVDCNGLSPDEVNRLFLEACKQLTTKPDLAKLKELVEYGADIKAHDHMGFAALKWATHIYDREVMRFFLEQGADINEVIHYKDKTVSTVWLNNVCYSKMEDLRLMLTYGARANDCDSDGNTALLKYCAGNPEHEGVVLLLEHGASVKAINKEKNSVLHLVARTTVDSHSKSVKVIECDWKRVL